jgi:hypothetical protein
MRLVSRRSGPSRELRAAPSPDVQRKRRPAAEGPMPPAGVDEWWPFQTAGRVTAGTSPGAVSHRAADFRGLPGDRQIPYHTGISLQSAWWRPAYGGILDRLRVTFPSHRTADDPAELTAYGAAGRIRVRATRRQRSGQRRAVSDPSKTRKVKSVTFGRVAGDTHARRTRSERGSGADGQRRRPQ